MPHHLPFSGAKIVLLCEGTLLIYQRDDKPAIPSPGLWDLPGGGRENDESPDECALRETWEEFSLMLDPATIVWRRVYPPSAVNPLPTWFLVAEVPSGQFAEVVFGNEGQRWAVTTVEAFLDRKDAVVHLQERLREYLVARST